MQYAMVTTDTLTYHFVSKQTAQDIVKEIVNSDGSKSISNNWGKLNKQAPYKHHCDITR